MPHFIIECNKEIVALHDKKNLVKTVFNAASTVNLFEIENIKTRLKVYDTFLVAGKEQNFIHIWGFIISGRTPKQKKVLSTSIVNALQALNIKTYEITCNIDELDSDSYFKLKN